MGLSTQHSFLARGSYALFVSKQAGHCDGEFTPEMQAASASVIALLSFGARPIGYLARFHAQKFTLLCLYRYISLTSPSL